MDIWQVALIVVGVAALPISELRGAIPLAIIHYRLAPLTAYLLSVTGNFLPVIPLLLGLDRLVGRLSRKAILDKLITRFFAHTRRRHGNRISEAGSLGLVALVAIPLPFTGAWTGVLVAWLFGVPFRYAWPLIALGILIAGLLVTLSTVGAVRIFF